MVTAATTNSPLELWQEEFEEKYPDAEVFELDLVKVFATNRASQTKVYEVLRQQCMNHYWIDYVILKATFLSETDAITCSATLEVLT